MERSLCSHRRTIIVELGGRPIGAGSLAQRRIIEGVIYQLKDYFFVERYRARTLDGMLAWRPRSQPTPALNG
jgi:hypothetical protein